MLKDGLNRTIEEDDICEVTNSMRSDRNTDAFTKLWQSELKKSNPSFLRVIFKLHGFKLLFLVILYAIGETMAR